MSAGSDGDTYRVSVLSDQNPLASRQYTEGMLASGTVDEFTVTTQQGTVYGLRH